MFLEPDGLMVLGAVAGWAIAQICNSKASGCLGLPTAAAVVVVVVMLRALTESSPPDVLPRAVSVLDEVCRRKPASVIAFLAALIATLHFGRST